MADVTTTFAAKDESFAKTVGNLQNRLTEFGGGVESFNSKVAGMASSFAKFAGPIAGVAAAFFGAKAAVDAFGNALAMGGRLDDLTKRTGATAGEMLLLEKAFSLAGSSAEAVGPTISKLNRFLAEASEAGSAQGETLQRLGLTYTQLAELSPSEQMRLLAERISSIESPALKTQAAMDVFGKSGGDLIPLLSDFSGELSKAGGFLGSLPGIMSENAAAFADLDDNVTEIRGKFDQFVAGLMTGMVPALTSVTDKLANLDAAGLGQAFSDYITRAAQAVANSYLLGEAIDNVKTAIDAIMSGNYSDGLSLMWVTMKITALNAINEIVMNFVAGLQTIGGFLAETLGPDSAMFSLVGSAFSLIAKNFEVSMSRAVAEIIKFIPHFGEEAALALNTAANAANVEANKLRASMGEGAREVAAEMMKAGAAMPQEFEKNKDALNPLFDLTNEFAEQKALQEGIVAQLAAAQPIAESIAAAGGDYATSLGIATAALESGGPLSAQIALNLTDASNAASGIAPAFDLAAGSSAQIPLNLESTSTYAEESSQWLKEGEKASQQVSIHGSTLPGNAQAFASAINQAKIDAEVTANVFTGLSDRMGTAVNNTSGMLDKMREAFHFGRTSAEEAYKKYRDGGMGILEASRAAAEHMAKQNKADADMRRAETKVRLAENAKDRAYERAERMDRAGQDRAAHDTRMRADAKLTKTLEEVAPQLKQGAEDAGRLLGDGASGAGDDVSTGGSSAGDSMTSGGDAAGESISTAASALKEAVSGMGEALALDATLKRCEAFLKNIDKKLPQNALS
jgi:hypothetical protein